MNTITQGKNPDIDDPLQDSWLQALSLRHGPVFKPGEGLIFWQRCVDDIERIQQQLNDAGYSAESRRDILRAQCALLDEAAKGRGAEDDACVQWYQMPLQGHFLGTIDEGDTLCERMRQQLRDPASDSKVLQCFQRTMMLGFLGGYPDENAPERQRLVKALTERVAVTSSAAVIGRYRSRRGVSDWLTAWPARAGLTALLLAALWWGLNHWLNSLLTTLLPGVK